MKWIFLLGLIFLVPVMAAQFRSNPRYLLWAGVAIGFLPFGLGPLHLYVAPVSWASWPGPVKGIEISLLDAIAVSIIIVTPRVRIPLPIMIAFSIYLFSVCLSVFFAVSTVPATFYPWQLFRTALVCIAVARATAAVEGMPLRILIGGAIALVIEAGYTVFEFAHGAVQAGGTFGHQNSLGLASHFVIYPAVALLLAGRRTGLAIAVVASEFVIVLLGGSRATVGLFAAGLILTLALSCWHRMSGRKMTIAACGLVTLGMAAPAMIWAVNRRPEAARESSNEERGQFIKAAKLMIADHPLGVGPNQYLLRVNMGGYSDRAGVPWTDRSSPVHNSYYLAAAEFGIVGVLGLMGMLLGTAVMGVRAVRRAATAERSDLLIGTFASFAIAAIHFAFEWVPMMLFFHYLFGITMGVLFGLRSSTARTRSIARTGERVVRTLQPA